MFHPPLNKWRLRTYPLSCVCSTPRRSSLKKNTTYVSHDILFVDLSEDLLGCILDSTQEPASKVWKLEILFSDKQSLHITAEKGRFSNDISTALIQKKK